MNATIKQALLGFLLLGTGAVWSAPLANPATAASGATIKRVDGKSFRGVRRPA
jgi:hypothetical protein